MTERLYYNDPALLVFDAKITDSGTVDDLHYTVLDSSAFYPTSGGQSFDTGTINGIDIVDVVETDDGDVWHISRDPIGETGNSVHCEINRERRNRNRQLHTAQHIISQAFITLFDRATVSVHLGDEYGAVELAHNEISDDQLAQVESMANDVIGRNLPVEIMFVDSSKAKDIPLRKIPDREGNIRVIKIGEFDWSACGGTHCLSTAEVGFIKLTGVEKMRGHALVKFLAGDLAREDYVRRFDITESLSRDLTCHVTDLPGKFEKLAAESKQLRKQLSDAQRELLPIRARNIAGHAEPVGASKLVATAVDDMDPSVVSPLATLVADEISGVAIFYASGRLVLATGSKTNLHAGDLIKKLAASFDLKGGGGQNMGQAGGASSDHLQLYKEAMVRLLNDA